MTTPHITEPDAIQPADARSTRRFNYDEIATLICAAGLILCFSFAPWTETRSVASSGFQIAQHATGRIYWLIPAAAIATLAAVRYKPAWRAWAGTAAAAVVAFIVIRLVARHGAAGIAGMRWGAHLSSLLAMGLFMAAGGGRINASMDFAARRLNSRKADVFEHWGAISPGCHIRAQEFYESIEKTVRAARWPGVEILRVAHTESGMLSHRREYLRLVRKRQLFDICCAPFGVDGFISVREAQIPAVVDLRVFLGLAFGLFVLSIVSVKLLGAFLGPFVLILLVASAVWFLFHVLKMGLTKVDGLLLKLPGVGAVYEAWFRKDTYFQQDSRLVFLQLVNDVLKKHVDEAASLQGVKLLRTFKHQPILDGIYKLSTVAPEDRREASSK